MSGLVAALALMAAACGGGDAVTAGGSPGAEATATEGATGAATATTATGTATAASPAAGGNGQAAAGCDMYAGETVTWVVPYSPGGGYDTYSRMLAPYLGEQLGATVVVENEPGPAGCWPSTISPRPSRTAPA